MRKIRGISKLHIRVILAKSWAKKEGYNDKAETEKEKAEYKEALFQYVDSCFKPVTDYKYVNSK